MTTTLVTGATRGVGLELARRLVPLLATDVIGATRPLVAFTPLLEQSATPAW